MKGSQPTLPKKQQKQIQINKLDHFWTTWDICEKKDTALSTCAHCKPNVSDSTGYFISQHTLAQDSNPIATRGLTWAPMGSAILQAARTWTVENRRILPIWSPIGGGGSWDSGDARAAPWAIEDFCDYESGRQADKVGSVKRCSQLQGRWGPASCSREFAWLFMSEGPFLHCTSGFKRGNFNLRNNVFCWTKCTPN